MPYLDLSYSAFVWLKAAHMVAVSFWLCTLAVVIVKTPRENLLSFRKIFMASHGLLAFAVASGVLLFFAFASPMEGWLHAKITFAVFAIITHGLIAQRLHRQGEQKVFLHPVLTFLPFVLFAAIVVCVIVRPF